MSTDERASSPGAGGTTDGSLAALLCALSFATSLGLGDRMDHGLRSAYIGLRLADALDLLEADREAVFYGALLKDAGCTACGSVIAAFFPEQSLDQMDLMMSDRSQLQGFMTLVTKYVPLDAQLPHRIAKLFAFIAQCQPVLREATAGHCEVGELFARRLGFPEHVQRAVRFQWERWDGKGVAFGLKGEAVPVAARVLHLSQTVEFAHSLGGPLAAETLARERASSRFDPDVAGAFLSLSTRVDFWNAMEREDVQATVLAMKPATAADAASENGADAVCEALADLIDARTRTTRHHSHTVADIASGIGGALGLHKSEVARLRRAALVHDLGLVAVPSGLLERTSRLSPAEWEQFRLHPHYTQQILQRVEVRELAADAADHHERLDGHGYPRHRTADDLSLASRIIALATRYAEGCQQGAESELVTQELRARVSTELDASCYEALLRWLGGRGPSSRARSVVPHLLSGREAEVLRLLAEGLTNPQIGDRLVVSRRTIEHHLEHIFDKLDVTSRTAAVAYAVHHGLD